jgi:hypothetical protein
MILNGPSTIVSGPYRWPQMGPARILTTVLNEPSVSQGILRWPQIGPVLPVEHLADDTTDGLQWAQQEYYRWS